jgi:hypothetical protein
VGDDRLPKEKKTILLSSKEFRDVAVLSIVIVISIILSAIYSPVFQSLVDSENWQGVLILGVSLFLFAFLILTSIFAVTKRFEK